MNVQNPRVPFKDMLVPAVCRSNPAQTVPPYSLLVTIHLRRQDLHRFTRLAQSLRNDFAAGGLELALSGWDVESTDVQTSARDPRTPSSARQPRQVELFSVWRLAKNDANSLLHAMQYLYDVIDYFALDSLQLSEYKVLAVRLASGTKHDQVTDEDIGKYVYLRTTNYVQTSKLAEFRARLRARLHGFCEQTGWKLGDAYLALTGSPNVVTQVWLVPEGSSNRFNSILASAAWDSLLETPPEYKLLQPAAFDPRFYDDLPVPVEAAPSPAVSSTSGLSDYSLRPRGGDR